jgi:hypothetical protein
VTVRFLLGLCVFFTCCFENGWGQAGPRRVALRTHGTVELDFHSTIVRVEPGLIAHLSSDEKERFFQSLARAAQGNFLYDATSLPKAPGGHLALDPSLTIQLPPAIDPEAEKAASIAAFANAHPRNGKPSARLIEEQWDEFRSFGTITTPSVNHPEIDHVAQVRVIRNSPLPFLRGKSLWYTGTQQIVLEWKKNLQTGIHELLVVIPDRLWPENYSETAALSFRQSIAGLLGDVRKLISQTVGLNESVPAFTRFEAETMVEAFRKQFIAVETLNAVHQNATRGEQAPLSVLSEAEAHWNSQGMKSAESTVDAWLSATENERGLSPETREHLRKILLETEQAKAVTRFLITHEGFGEATRGTNLDLRLLDEDLMAAVSAHLETLKAEHETQWLSQSALVAAKIYGDLSPQFTHNTEGLLIEASQRLAAAKELAWFEIILRDAALNQVHPRAEGIGALVVEHGKAIRVIEFAEQKHANDLWNERSRYLEQVDELYPLKSFSEKFRDAKLRELLQQAYHRGKQARYEALVEVLRTMGLNRSAHFLRLTLDGLAYAEKETLPKLIRSEQIPARALNWSMPALNPSEWTVVERNGSFSGTPAFRAHLTTQQAFWRVQALGMQMARAYRTARRYLYTDQFINGPFGIRAWGTPFEYVEMVDEKTGQVVLDSEKKRRTWVSNMNAIYDWGKGVAMAKAPGIIPGFFWRAGCVTTAVTLTPTLWALSTVGRAAGFTAVTASTAVFGSRLGAGAFVAPVAGLLSTSLNHFVYDANRPVPSSESAGERTAALRNKKNWLFYGAAAAGALTASYQGYTSYDTSTWMELAKTLGSWGAGGVASGLGLSWLATLETKGFFKLPALLATGVTSSLEKIMGSLGLASAFAAKGTLVNIAGGTGLAGTKGAQNFVVRNILLRAILDGIFVGFGGSGVGQPRRTNFLTEEIKGAGVSSQHFVRVDKGLALAALYALFEKRDLENWVERRKVFSQEPRANFLATTAVDQLAISGSSSVTGNPIGVAIRGFESREETEIGAARLTLNVRLYPVLNFLAQSKDKIRFQEAELIELRGLAAKLLEKCFTDLADPMTTGAQRAALFGSYQVGFGDWSALADRMLVEAFGAGVLQPIETLDSVTTARVGSDSVTQVLMKVIGGEDILLGGNPVELATIVPEALAHSPIETLTPSDLCSTRLLREARSLPWQTAGK